MATARVTLMAVLRVAAAESSVAVALTCSSAAAALVALQRHHAVAWSAAVASAEVAEVEAEGDEGGDGQQAVRLGCLLLEMKVDGVRLLVAASDCGLGSSLVGRDGDSGLAAAATPTCPSLLLLSIRAVDTGKRKEGKKERKRRDDGREARMQRLPLPTPDSSIRGSNSSSALSSSLPAPLACQAKLSLTPSASSPCSISGLSQASSTRSDAAASNATAPSPIAATVASRGSRWTLSQQHTEQNRQREHGQADHHTTTHHTRTPTSN